MSSISWSGIGAGLLVIEMMLTTPAHVRTRSLFRASNRAKQ